MGIHTPSAARDLRFRIPAGPGSRKEEPGHYAPHSFYTLVIVSSTTKTEYKPGSSRYRMRYVEGGG